jgi:hypothetical protein
MPAERRRRGGERGRREVGWSHSSGPSKRERVRKGSSSSSHSTLPFMAPPPRSLSPSSLSLLLFSHQNPSHTPTGCVDQDQLLAVREGDLSVHSVPGRPGHVAHDGALLPADGVHQAALACEGGEEKEKERRERV